MPAAHGTIQVCPRPEGRAWRPHYNDEWFVLLGVLPKISNVCWLEQIKTASQVEIETYLKVSTKTHL
eukprot:905857-Lingulodinium_polyedra.AAC.1